MKGGVKRGKEGAKMWSYTLNIGKDKLQIEKKKDLPHIPPTKDKYWEYTKNYYKSTRSKQDDRKKGREDMNHHLTEEEIHTINTHLKKYQENA